MPLRSAFAVVPVGAMIAAAAALAPLAFSAHGVQKHHLLAHTAGGNVNCSGIQATNVPNDLSVPSGKTCTILPGVKIGNDVIVNSEATLIDNAAVIGHDIDANQPKGIGIGGFGSTMGSIGHDVNVTGITGAGPGTKTPGDNYICHTAIKHDIEVRYSASKAGEWLIGDVDEECRGGGNQIGNNASIRDNANRVDISDNMQGESSFIAGIGKNLTVTGNLVSLITPVVESNFVAGNATCQAGTTKDHDGTANVVDGRNNGCH